MLRITALDSSMAVTTSSRSLFISTMSALSMATSVPAPMAMPTSARASAGASLTPSPTIATLWPASWSLRTSCSLSWGSTSATTRVMPICRWMAAAVFLLSPVSITTSMPSFFSSAMAVWLVGLTTSATAMMPSTSAVPPFFRTKKRGVLPSSASRSASASRGAGSMPSASSILRLPA